MVTDYTSQFNKISHYACSMIPNFRSKVDQYVQGLSISYFSTIIVDDQIMMENAMNKALDLELKRIKQKGIQIVILNN